MGNHIGASTLVVTKCGQLVLWRQDKAAQQSERLLVPSGSGSIEWKDFDSGSLHTTVTNGMKREFEEECTRQGGSINKNMIEHSAVIGFFRWTLRGGKPEFVGIAKLTVDYSELHPNAAEVYVDNNTRFTWPARNRGELLVSLNSLLKRNDLSVPLWVNLTCLKDALENNGERQFWNKFFSWS